MQSNTAGVTSRPEFGLSRLLRDTFDLQDGSVSSILNELLHAARLYLGMDVAFISEFDGGRRIFRYVDQARDTQLIKVGESDPLDESYCQRVVDGRLPEVIHDAQALGEARSIAATLKLGIGAHVSVPIRLSDGSVFGTLCSFTFHADCSLNERDLALMQVFSQIASGLIERDVEKARDEERCKQRITRLLGDETMTMVWQPILSCADHRVVGVEALARFPREPHPGPAQWFAEAASVGLSRELETMAVKKGLALLEKLPPDLYVSCNTSAGAFLEPGLPELLEQAPLDRVVLEITEHDVIEDYELLAEKLAPLRRSGLRLAVDDAGAGYASFRHILRLRPEMIKLDMSLTRDIDTDISRRSLGTALVRFANELGSVLVAEGVETRAELDTLLQLGVHKVQGYFLHRPKPLEELGAIIPLR